MLAVPHVRDLLVHYLVRRHGCRPCHETVRGVLFSVSRPTGTASHAGGDRATFLFEICAHVHHNRRFMTFRAFFPAEG